MEKKRKYSQWKFITAFVVVMGLFAGVKYAFGIEVKLEVRGEGLEVRGEGLEVRGEELEVRGEELEVSDDIENTEDEVLFEEVTDSVDSVAAPVMVGGAHRVRGVWSYSACFPDSQSVQIEAAQKYGIMPVKNRKEAEVLVKHL